MSGGKKNKLWASTFSGFTIEFFYDIVLLSNLTSNIQLYSSLQRPPQASTSYFYLKNKNKNKQKTFPSVKLQNSGPRQLLPSSSSLCRTIPSAVHHLVMWQWKCCRLVSVHVTWWQEAPRHQATTWASFTAKTPFHWNRTFWHRNALQCGKIWKPLTHFTSLLQSA